MSDTTAIVFDDVSKHYHVDGFVHLGMKHFLLHFGEFLRERSRRHTFNALSQVSFTVARGETFGLIGRNGSGKSTILGLIAGVLRANSGSVRASGRIAPLLELGAGFHPELTGRDNIILNAIILGINRDLVQERMDSICAFSELGDFIDRPMRTYSSGMLARLGFSVAMHLDPEILLVDEILAVGDAGFQRKCLERIAEFHERGITIVYVSHNLGEVERICSRAGLLDGGRLIALGEPRSVIARYEELLKG